MGQPQSASVNPCAEKLHRNPYSSEDRWKEISGLAQVVMIQEQDTANRKRFERVTEGFYDTAQNEASDV